MLLTDLARGLTRRDREAGSALAGVIGILAATGVVAATLLAVAVFGAGFTSASRAGVQAQAAAEGGIEYARANLGLCDPLTGAITSPAGTVPVFRVAVSWRTKRTAPWTAGCMPLDAVELRLVSTGTAAAPGAAGNSRGDTRTMAAVYGYEFPFLINADKGVTLTGSLTVHDTTARPADVNSNDSFECGGGFTIAGTLYVAGTANCSGKTVVSGFDTTSAPHAFPRLTPGDPRWPKAPLSMPGNTCALTSTHVTLTRGAVQCPGALKFSAVTVDLHGDVVVFAPSIEINDMSVRSVGGRFSLYLVKPWPTGHACAKNASTDALIKKVVTDSATSMMLYSSGKIQVDSPEGVPVRLQLYACAIDTKGSPKMALAPTGPLLLQHKRDVTG